MGKQKIEEGRGGKTHYINEEETEEEGIIVKPGATDLCLMGPAPSDRGHIRRFPSPPRAKNKRGNLESPYLLHTGWSVQKLALLLLRPSPSLLCPTMP